MLVRIGIGGIARTTKGSKVRIGRNFIEKELIRGFVI